LGDEVNSNKVILLIEDNPSDVDLTRRALKRSHISTELVVAEDGEEALNYLWGAGAHADRDTSELPDLTLLDLKLPKLAGLDLLQRIRSDARTRRLPIVILSTSKEEEDVAAGYDLGVNSYVCKPVDFKQFERVIEQLGLYWLSLNEAPPKVI
jgi:two-component system response regulator